MAKTIHATSDDLKAHQSLTQALGLQDLQVVGQHYEPFSNTLILTCVSRWPVGVCPDCGRPSSYLHDYPNQRRIHDAPIGSKAILLVFDCQRFDCEHCQKPFTQQIRDVVPDCTYTYRLAQYLADGRRKQDVSTLAKLYGLGYKLVESILFKAAEAKLQSRADEPLDVEHLGIDEITLLKGSDQYVLVLTDLKRRLVIDILPDRNKKTLVDWLSTPPTGIGLSNLSSVATDLWTHYRDAVLAVYPKVPIVADRFHVVQQLNETIHNIRRQAQKAATTDDERSELKGLRFLLLKNFSNLKDKDRLRLEQLKKNHPILYAVWDLRQKLHDWYEKDNSPEQALLSLKQWIEDARSLGLEQLDKFCNTLENWQTEITNFFASRITSGFVEGMNNKIKLIKRIAFGIPNFEHFRLRVLGACG